MISLIVAFDKNKCIGNDNKIPWKIKNDMKRVRDLTTNQTILMGRKTYDSIGRALPNRINRVLTRDTNFTANGIEVYTNKESSIDNIKTEKLFIFGGTQVYKEFIDLCEEMYITEVGTTIKGDSYFPNIDLDKWFLVSENKYKEDSNNEFDYTFKRYLRVR
ncbi:dihydrofolate reductase [Gemelliphila palaticanis]|uniref:Dihydrofolate reductase n=1 Tax=Gemelliphila palaticanis TaxID=81950 RepID=A0ABX2SYZ2_9BACL|nr:dihydrofolate reductase [Gemella palaticanis]MBF0715613.1 dihydrofolate reductase [Gemella palaticanis]NYS47543.1 dihydrofolate reductase [Gemella palaticanis]